MIDLTIVLVLWDRGNYYDYYTRRWMSFAAKYLDKLENTKLGDFVFPVPSLSEDFLKAKYGSDWRTPKKEWNVGLDDGSVVKPW